MVSGAPVPTSVSWSNFTNCCWIPHPWRVGIHPQVDLDHVSVRGDLYSEISQDVPAFLGRQIIQAFRDDLAFAREYLCLCRPIV